MCHWRSKNEAIKEFEGRLFRLDQGGITWRAPERMQQKGFNQPDKQSLARQMTPREGQQKGAETGQ